jgi:hypothetical protein
VKALSLTQPWATLVAIGAKRIETRSWATSYRGPLAIHAAQGFPKEARELCEMEPFKSALAEAGIHCWRDLPRGAVVAIAELLDCRDTDYWIRHGISTQEHDFGDYGAGRYGWLLNLRERVEPAVPTKGALGLWRWGPDGEPIKANPQMELTL